MSSDTHRGRFDVPLTTRIDSAYSAVENDAHLPMRLMATDEVPIEPQAIKQALVLSELAQQLRDCEQGELTEAVLTPDLHRGPGIPVGVVADVRDALVPAMIGNDIGCGMRLLALDINADELDGHLPRLRDRLRQLFFEGQREIALSPRQREAVLREGLYGLLDLHTDNAAQGIWRLYDAAREEQEVMRVHQQGSLVTTGVFSGLSGYVQGSGRSDARDSQLGSVGGGNHFAELGVVDALYDPVAPLWGLKEGVVTIMVHSGSLAVGSAIGAHYARQLRKLGLPTAGPLRALAAEQAQEFVSAMNNAANFAFVNRLLLGLMMARAVQEVVGREVDLRLVGDAPHNLICAEADGIWRHRKGATPALGPAAGPFAASGEPVLIPGSMGDHSFVLAGHGDERALASASHGAGRLLGRGEAASSLPNPDLDVVGPVDPQRLIASGRRDLAATQLARLREEAPGAYKPVAPVIDSVVAAGAARRVARLAPLLTVKG